MLLNILIVSLFCTGVHIVFKDGFLMGCIGNSLRVHLPHYFSAPLFDCLVCMGGFWGATGLYFLTYDWQSVFYFPCIIGANAILNGIINKYYEF